MLDRFDKPFARRAFGAPAHFLGSVARLWRLDESLITDAAQFLTLLEIRPTRGRALQAGGFDPFEAAVAYVRGEPTMLQLAILGDQVVIATPTSVTYEDLGDGYGSTVELTVNEVLSGRENRNNTIRYRQRSGETTGYVGDLTPEDRNQSLFVLSRGQYREFATSNGATPVVNRNGRPAYFTTMSSRFEVDGDQIRPAVLSRIQPMALSELRTQLQPLVRFRRANNLEPAE